MRHMLRGMNHLPTYWMKRCLRDERLSLGAITDNAGKLYADNLRFWVGFVASYLASPGGAH